MKTKIDDDSLKAYKIEYITVRGKAKPIQFWKRSDEDALRYARNLKTSTWIEYRVYRFYWYQDRIYRWIKL